MGARKGGDAATPTQTKPSNSETHIKSDPMQVCFKTVGEKQTTEMERVTRGTNSRELGLFLLPSRWPCACLLSNHPPAAPRGGRPET